MVEFLDEYAKQKRTPKQQTAKASCNPYRKPARHNLLFRAVAGRLVIVSISR